MRINAGTDEPVKIEGEEVESFTYLGNVMDKSGGTDTDVKTRIGKAQAAFNMLKKVWSSREISTSTKVCLFNSNIKWVLLYGAETWRTINALMKKIQTFINQCLRGLLRIHWPETISNENLWARTQQTPVEEDIPQRRYSWLCRMLRKPPSSIGRQALNWKPQGQRKRGRPRNTWRRVWKEFCRFFEGSSGLYALKATVGSKCLFSRHGNLVSFPVQRLYCSFVQRFVIFGLFKGSTSRQGDNILFRESNKSHWGAFKLLREAYKPRDGAKNQLLRESYKPRDGAKNQLLRESYKPRDGAKNQLLRESCASRKEIEQCLETVGDFTSIKALSKQIHLVNNVKCLNCKNAFLTAMPGEKKYLSLSVNEPEYIKCTKRHRHSRLCSVPVTCR